LIVCLVIVGETMSESAGDGVRVHNESSVTGNSVQAGVVHGGVHFHQPARQALVVPRQLPGAARHFVDRAVEQDILTTLLNGASSDGAVLISTIDGTAGVGKSSLAVHWAHQRRDRFPDGELYVNLRGFDPAAEPMMPAEALASFLTALDIAAERIPEDLDARAALFRSVVHNKRLLILLDNARSAEHVRLLLPGGPTCLVLVTSRNRLDDLVVQHGAIRLSLNVLTDDEGRRLFGRYVGQERIDAEPEAVDALIAHCAGLPLALGLVAVHAAGNPDFPLADLAADLADEQERLNTLDSGGETGVRTVFSWSYRSLPTDAARMFRLLGLHTGPDIACTAAADLAGVTGRAARRSLAELARANLIEQHVAGRYRFHDLLRAYATERATQDESAADREAAIRRLLDHYLRTSHAIDRQLTADARPFAPQLPESEIEGLAFADERAALAWWDEESANLVAAMRQASSRGFDVHAWQFAYTLTYFFKLRSVQEDQQIYENALESAQRLGDLTAQAHILLELASAHYSRGQYETSARLNQRSIDLFAERGDRYWESKAWTNRGYDLVALQRFDEAETSFQRGLETQSAAGDLTGQGYGHYGLGLLNTGRGRFEEAVRHFREALRCQEESGEEFAVGLILHELARTYADAETPTAAIDTFRRAVAHRQEIGHRQGEAASLRGLGTALRDSGDVDGARQAWEQALAILDDLADSEADVVRTDLRDLE
jgi:tetratricopeptide (TPR) repeat protein